MYFSKIAIWLQYSLYPFESSDIHRTYHYEQTYQYDIQHIVLRVKANAILNYSLSYIVVTKTQSFTKMNIINLFTFPINRNL